MPMILPGHDSVFLVAAQPRCVVASLLPKAAIAQDREWKWESLRGVVVASCNCRSEQLSRSPIYSLCGAVPT